MDIDTKIRAYRFVGYAAVAFSAVAVLSVSITLPLVYNYVHHVRSQLSQELSVCKGTARKIWTSVYELRDAPVRGNRTARQPIEVPVTSTSNPHYDDLEVEAATEGSKQGPDAERAFDRKFGRPSLRGTPPGFAPHGSNRIELIQPTIPFPDYGGHDDFDIGSVDPTTEVPNSDEREDFEFVDPSERRFSTMPPSSVPPDFGAHPGHHRFTTLPAPTTTDAPIRVHPTVQAHRQPSPVPEHNVITPPIHPDHDFDPPPRYPHRQNPSAPVHFHEHHNPADTFVGPSTHPQPEQPHRFTTSPTYITDPDHHNIADDQCSGCCLPGPAGPPGPPGKSGKPGVPGAPGSAGNPGRPPQQPCQPITATPCQPCAQGIAGPRGPPGLPGDNGAPGPAGKKGNTARTGTTGRRGPPGPPGPARGEKGRGAEEREEPGRGALDERESRESCQWIPPEEVARGPPGNPGPNGEPGEDARSEPAVTGPPGAPGTVGPQGQVGAPGTNGAEGKTEEPGAKGPPGLAGKPGEDWEPGRRGTPGLPGHDGEKGICPKYCAMDGGIFFEDGTRR